MHRNNNDLNEQVSQKLSDLVEAGFLEEDEIDLLIESANDNGLSIEEFDQYLDEIITEEVEAQAVEEILESLGDMVNEGELTEDEANYLIDEGIVEYVLENNYNLSQTGEDGEEAGVGNEKDEAMSGFFGDKNTEDLPSNKDGQMAGIRGPSELAKDAIFKLFDGGSNKVAAKTPGSPNGAEKQTGQD